MEAAQQTTAPGEVTVKMIHVEIKTKAEVPRQAAEHIAAEFLEWLDVHTSFVLETPPDVIDERSFKDLAHDFIQDWG